VTTSLSICRVISARRSGAARFEHFERLLGAAVHSVFCAASPVVASRQGAMQRGQPVARWARSSSMSF